MQLSNRVIYLLLVTLTVFKSAFLLLQSHSQRYVKLFEIKKLQ